MAVTIAKRPGGASPKKISRPTDRKRLHATKQWRRWAAILLGVVTLYEPRRVGRPAPDMR